MPYSEESAPAAAGGEVLEGRVPEQLASTRLPKLPRTWAFILFFSPTAWEVYPFAEGARLIPSLRSIPERGGVHQTGVRGARTDTSVTVARRQQRGWIPLYPQGEYLRVHNGQSGPFHCDRWTRVTAYDDGTAFVSHDREGYARWRLSLVESGRVPPPRPDVVARLERQARTTLARSGARPRRDNEVAAALHVAAQEQVARVSAAAAAAHGEAVGHG